MRRLAIILFLNEVELVICNGRQLVLELEWTRVRLRLDKKSVIRMYGCAVDKRVRRSECRFY